jgi:hypothetical protein
MAYFVRKFLDLLMILNAPAVKSQLIYKNFVLIVMLNLLTQKNVDTN